MPLKDRAKKSRTLSCSGEKNSNGGFSVDICAVRALATVLTESSLTEIEYSQEATRIRVCRSPAFSEPVYSISHGGHSGFRPMGPLPSVSEENPCIEPEGTVISSPMVGTVYLAPKPDAAPFIRVGDTVEKGQTLLIIEAMKVMNPLASPISGKIVEICAQNGVPVEFGEILVRIM